MFLQPRQSFMQHRIMDLQQALFFSDNQSVLKFPVSIINVLHADEVGQIWFVVNRPTQHLNEFDREFRARLNFYKKGKNYYIHVCGKVRIINDPEEINSIYELGNSIKKLASTSMALIIMKISDIQYFPVRKHHVLKIKPAMPKLNLNPSAFIKSLQYIIKDIIPVFQSH